MGIFASGDLDEYRIAELLEAGAPIDAFGVGTQLGTSGDASSLGAVYKLVEDVTGPKAKLSRGKATRPGRKQVWRAHDGEGHLDHDVLALDSEEVHGARPLLRQVMAEGRRTGPPETLEALRARCRSTLAALPPGLRQLSGADRPYPVEVSTGLEAVVGSLPPR